MKKILAIGNSFSEDATAYLDAIAKSVGIEAKIRNLYIGGCSLETHATNIKENNPAYDYQIDGVAVGEKCTIEKALLEDDWDVVTHQQASGLSGKWGTYEPHLSECYEYVKKLCPNAEQWIHETWTYEKNADHPHFEFYDRSIVKMYNDLKDAYEKAAKTINGKIIPCGEVIARLREYPCFDVEKGGESLNRDGFHMHMIYGRYLTAATWLEMLLDGNILESDFIPPMESVPEDFNARFELVKKVVHEVCQEYKNK